MNIQTWRCVNTIINRIGVQEVYAGFDTIEVWVGKCVYFTGNFKWIFRTLFWPVDVWKISFPRISQAFSCLSPDYTTHSYVSCMHSRDHHLRVHTLVPASVHFFIARWSIVRLDCGTQWPREKWHHFSSVMALYFYALQPAYRVINIPGEMNFCSNNGHRNFCIIPHLNNINYR